MNEEWVTQNEYMRRYGFGFDSMKHLIRTQQVEVMYLQNGNIRIKVGGNSVPREQYESVLKENVKLHTEIENIRKIVN